MSNQGPKPLFAPVSISEELLREKELREKKEHKLMDQVRDLLNKSTEKDAEVLSRLKTPNYDTPSELVLTKYDAARLFSSEDIHKICSKYRLRFLDSSYFKSEFPYDALSEVKRFEDENNIRIEKFRMIAPPDMFKLEDRCKKDPLLFAQVNENTYYLIHQWGTDLAWYRALLMWPLRNLYHFAYTMLALSVLVTFLTPIDWIIRNEHNMEQIVYYRIAYFAHTAIFLLGFSFFLGLTFRKNFSEQEWDNQCFN